MTKRLLSILCGVLLAGTAWGQHIGDSEIKPSTSTNEILWTDDSGNLVWEPVPDCSAPTGTLQLNVGASAGSRFFCGTDADSGAALTVGKKAWITKTGVDSATCGDLSDPCLTIRRATRNLGDCTAVNNCTVKITEGLYCDYTGGNGTPITFARKCSESAANPGIACSGKCCNDASCAGDNDSEKACSTIYDCYIATTANSECTAADTPYPCCTGSGTGTCTTGEDCRRIAKDDTCGSGTAGTAVCDSKSNLIVVGEPGAAYINVVGQDLLSFDVSNTNGWGFRDITIGSGHGNCGLVSNARYAGVLGSTGNATNGITKFVTITDPTDSEVWDNANPISFKGWGNFTNNFIYTAIFASAAFNDAASVLYELGTGTNSGGVSGENCGVNACKSLDATFDVFTTQTSGWGFAFPNALGICEKPTAHQYGQKCTTKADCGTHQFCDSWLEADVCECGPGRGADFNVLLEEDINIAIGEDNGDSSCYDPTKAIATVPIYHPEGNTDNNTGHGYAGEPVPSQCTSGAQCAGFGAYSSCDTDTDGRSYALAIWCSGHCELAGGARAGERCDVSSDCPDDAACDDGATLDVCECLKPQSCDSAIDVKDIQFKGLTGQSPEISLHAGDGAEIRIAASHFTIATADEEALSATDPRNTTNVVGEINPLFGGGKSIWGRLGIGINPTVNALQVHGTDSSIDGPHARFTTTADAHPLLAFLPFAHDNVSISFDAYFNGTNWISSDAGSNFNILKNADVLRFQRKTGITAGSIITWTNQMFLESDGTVSIRSGDFQIVAYPNPPATCVIGDLFFDSTSGAFCACTATNTWEDITDVVDGTAGGCV